ncbi:unnamed protein product [Rotaria magnacalcarata]|uniref:Uncharacterized protein n=1 Tax=Rotaria magnacalcarata TaxID=392030 RepID=A0A819H910_9BILA|nr:unnamed protein product [Rotaria magnacalcarata]
MSSRPQKSSLRDFMLVHAHTRAYLCSDDEIFDLYNKLIYLTSFEKATLTSWSADCNVDKGLNLYLQHHRQWQILALTPHLDDLGRALAQLDINQNYIQCPNKTNELLFEQSFIISNATALHVYRSLIYGNLK